MEFLVALIGLGSILVGIVALVGIVCPMPLIGLKTRKKALGILALSFISFIIAADISSGNSTKRDAHWLQWTFFAILAYGLFRLVRRGKRRDEIASKHDSSVSPVSDVTPTVATPFWTATVDLPSSRTQSGLAKKVSPSSNRALRWIESGGEATVAGRKIGGMVYLGSESRQENWGPVGGAFIDPGLSVARVGSDFSGESMPYWPNYRDINPRARATYLDWLAGGRADKRFGLGYVFLYFYGLERRFFVDTPAQDERRVLVAEVKRLLDVYRANRSVQRYFRAFLDAAQIVLEPVDEAEPRFEKSGYELPLELRVAIGQMAKEGQPLSADWLLGWYITHPETSLRTTMKRAFPECRALFTLLFDDQFPEGLRIRSPRRPLCARYVAASRGFEVDLKHFLRDVPDISGMSKPLIVAKELVEKVTDALAKYSYFLGRNPEGRDTIEAHVLLPERLWPLFPCRKMENLRHWAEGIIKSGGFLPVEQIIEQLEGVAPKKINNRQLTGAADALARLSIGMAPDPRFALRSPKLGEPVVLFKLPQGITALEEVSDKYKNILVSIAIGSFVIHADGTIAAKERNELEARITAADLSETEQARLFANLEWMLAIPPDLALFRRHLKDIPESTSHEFGQIALAMVAADGVIDPGEIKAIERLYKVIGLKTDDVYSDLHALTAKSEPVTVRKADTQARGFAIPPSPERDNKVVLDAGRVASLMADTARVSSVLVDIFREDESEEDLEETQEDTASDFPGLDGPHAAFLGDLMTRPHWDEAEFVALRDSFG